TISVNETDIRRTVMTEVKAKARRLLPISLSLSPSTPLLQARRLLRMLDIMAAACLGQTGIAYSIPWRKMLVEMSHTKFITDPFYTLPDADADANAAAAASVEDEEMKKAKHSAGRERQTQDVWPYLQGNHAVKVVTPATVTEPMSLAVSPYPQYPVYMFSIETEWVPSTPRTIEAEKD
ncbi:hypothetical protein KIPB_010980, partial [Kipferlia bialata]